MISCVVLYLSQCNSKTLFRKLSTMMSVRCNSAFSYKYLKNVFRSFSTLNECKLSEPEEPITELNQFDKLEETVLPLSKFPYEEQLHLKYKHIKKAIQTVRDKYSVNIPKFSIYPVAPSPETEYYRNKNEFNFRTGPDGDPKTLGFFIGRPRGKKTICVRPTYLKCVKQRHKDIARVFEDFVKNSPLPACHDLHDGGYWRSLVVRTNEAGDTMATVIVHPRNRTELELEKERNELKEHFEQNNCSLTSLYHHASPHVRCSKEIVPYVLVHGEPHIYENLFEYKFRISPDSFFQTNTKGAEVLYLELFKLAELKSTSTILDLCCGTGTISLLSSKYVRNSIGVDEVFSCVEDAQHNAVVNRVFNCEFIPARVEFILKTLTEDQEISDLTAFLNPGRAGIHDRAIRIVRRSSNIRKLLYISCDVSNQYVNRNIAGLIRADDEATEPFRLVNIKPVDLFPHTNHCETIMLFVRS